MARKRIYGLTSDARYEGKMYQLFLARTGSPEYARSIAEKANSSWVNGFAPYHIFWKDIKVMLGPDLPPALSGIYRAFFNELMNKVKMRRIMTLNELIVQWQRKFGPGFDVNLAIRIANAVGIRLPEQGAATAQKT